MPPTVRTFRMSRFRRVAALCLFAGAGCSGTDRRDPTAAPLGGIHEDALATPGWLDLEDLSLHTDAEPEGPTGLHVRGRILGGIFEPATGVEGGALPPMPQGLLAATLGLSDRSIVLERDGATARPPYLAGGFDENSGRFHPRDGTVCFDAPATGRPAGVIAVPESSPAGENP